MSMKPGLTGKRFKKVYGTGGMVDPNDPSQKQGLSSAIAAGGTIVGSVADAMDSGNKYGRQRGLTVGLKQGATLAAAGATLAGPWGAAIGGGIGLAEGLIGSIGAKKAENAQDRDTNYQNQLNSQQQGNAMYAANPNAKFGNTAASNFAGGGILPNSGPTKPLKPAYDPTKAPTYNPALLTNGKFIVSKPDGSLGQWGKDLPPVAPLPVPISPPITPLSDKAMGYSSTYYSPVQQNQSKAIPEIQSPTGRSFGSGGSIHIKPSHEGRFTAYKKATGKTTEQALHSKDSHVRKMAQFAKNAAGWKKAFGGPLDSNLPPNQQVPGGSLSPMNSSTLQVNGDSHAQGGVQLPQAEVEGGETISNGFVFSKEMGFADLHKPIANAIGKIEKKPMNPVRRQTLGILKGRELGLALAQESIKHTMGMPSDLMRGGSPNAS